MKAKLITVTTNGKFHKHAVEFSDGDGHMVSVHFDGRGEVVHDRDGQVQTEYPVFADYPVIDSRGRQLSNVADVRAALDALVYPKMTEPQATKILDRIGYRAWINHPSTAQRLHRFHGQNGWVVTNEMGGAVFHFASVPTVTSAIEIAVNESEISRGWK